MIASLRGRLLWGIIGGMVILLLVFSILLYNVIHNALNNQFDASLLATARILIATIETKEDFESTGQQERIKLEIDTHIIPEFSGNLAAGFYQLQRQDGQLIARSPSLKDQLLTATEISEKPRYRKILLPGRKPGRSVCIWFVPAGKKNETQFESAKEKRRLLALVIARDTSDLYEQFMFLRLLFTVASAAVILLSVIIGSLVVKTSLKSLNGLAKDIARVNVDTLGNPLDLAKLPSEMAPVVQKFNDLLDRLKLSFERERCFTSDVAHELRTPLAGIRSTLEVALLRQRDLPAYQESMADCLSIAREMQELVDKLLALARLDTNQITLTRNTFSIAELIENCWKPFAETARTRNIAFENHVSEKILCRTDKEYLAMALTNLLENSAEYTNTGGRIWFESRESQQHITLTLANTGCNLSSEQAGKVFDRFWRADSSRSDTGVHCGLGLALVEKIIRSLNGNIYITSNDGVFSATLVLNNHSI
ncbi:MAG: GHKL domain-containing protein [Planctomycetes bacterium]|nr:GHKL domain-containing protein [Planctomycetota bacterium]